MKSEISLKNKKALNIPEKGFIHKTAVMLSSDCEKVSENNVSYDFLFKRTASRNDLLSVLNRYSKGTHINLEDGDYVIDAHDYSIRTTKEGIKVSGSFSLIPIALSNPHVKQLTALQDFDQEYSKMEMTEPETYFRVFPYQNFNGPAFRSKLFSYVSNMGENYGYCDGKNIYYRRASLIMPKIKITKAIPQAKMMFHTHPKRDEPSLSSPDDYLLYFDLSHKPRNIRHFYTVMADRMDYFHVTPKHDKKNDYVKINEDKFIERLDKKIDEISKIYDEKLPSGTKQDDLYYCERITKDVVKWLNKEYKKYFKIKYKCYYRVKKNPDKDKGEDLHLGDAFLAKALNDIKSGDYSWPEFEEDSIPHEKYAYWYSMYYGMRMDRSGMGYSRILRLQPGDVRRLHHFGSKRFEGTQYDYFDIINILLLNYDISLATAKVQDGNGTSSRIAEILDYLELDDENAREDLILLTQVLESGIYSDEARTRAGNHYFILPLVEFCVLALQAIEDVNDGKATYEQKKYEVMILEAEKAGEATGNALGALMSMYDGQKSSLPNPPLNKGAFQYTSVLPKAELANVELLKEVLQEFAPSKSPEQKDADKPFTTGRGAFNLRIPTDEAVVTMLLYPSTGTAQVTVPAGHSDPDAIAISAMKKFTDHLNGLGFEIPDDDIAVIISEPVRNPKNSIIISVASPIQKVKNEVLSSLEKRIRDSTIATTYTTKPLKEYEKRPHLVEVTDDMYNRLLSNGDIIMGISYSDNIRRGYKRSDFENSKYVLVDTMIKDQDLLTKANTSIMSFYIHPTNAEGEIEDYLKEHVSPQEARNVSGLIDYLRDMAGEDTFDHIIEYDINSPAYAVEQVFKEVPKSNPKGTVPLEQTIFGDGSRYLTAQTIPITALQALNNPNHQMVITISGPSGSGKSTILRKIAEMTKADIVPTVTTRERRPKEKVSDDRIFVSKDDFKQMIENGEFVEWKQQMNGHYYGRRFSDFKDVSIVDVSLKGSREYKSKFPNSFSIFLKPNVSAKVLASHMRKRGGMSEAERKGRADIIERFLESASKMDFDLVVTSRAGEYEKVAEEIIPQIPIPNPKKYQSQASVIISRSTKKDKKLMAVFDFPDGRRKTTHFGGKGYSDYTIHKDKERKKRYDTRHARREDWEDFTTAGALSKWILWNKPSLIDSFNHYKAMFSLDGAITVKTSQAGKIPASRNPPVKLVSRTGTDDNVSRFFNKKTGEELTGKVFDSATIDTKDGTSLEVGKEIDPVELVGVKRQYNVAKLNDRTVIQVGNGTNRLFEKIDFKLPVHLEYDPMSLGEPSAFITTRGVLIFDESEDNYTLVKRSEVTDFKGVSKTDSPMLVPLYKYAKVVKRTPGIRGGPVENPPLTYDLTSMVTPRHLKRVNDRLFPQKMKSWDKKPDKEKERLITRSEEFRRDLEYAYGWKGRTAKTAIEAILSDYAKSFDKNGYAKVYRGLITLPSENLKEAWDKYGVGESWSSYKEGADDYVWTPVSGIPGAVLVLVEGRVHVEDVSQTDRQLSLRIGFPLEKEIQIVDRVEVTKYSMWRIDPEDRVKKPKWETTGKNWKPWLRRGVKPISVVEVNQTFPAHTSESEPTPFLPNPNQDYYAIIDGEPIYSNPSKTPEGRKIPKRYLKGLNKEEMIIAAKEIDKGYKYDIDDPKAYEFWKSDIKATARGYKTVPSKYKKKFIEMYGPLPEEGEFLDKMAKATKIKKSILEKVYDKGLAAWRGGHRPGVQQHQWAAGRVYSFVTLGNTVMKDGKRMSDHSLAVEAGLIKKNPNHIKISHYPDPDPEAEEGMMRIDLHEDGKNIGYLLWRESGDVINIQYLNVKGDYRKQGLGKLLLDELRKMHKGKKIQLHAPLGQHRDWIPEWYQRYGFEFTEPDSNLMVLQNPGWRHGEQMEDDPFSEYFDENVEGDENTTTA